MGKYTEDARQLLALVGGRENISAVAHCMTRMRFVLIDPSKADLAQIEAMKCVKGTFTQAGQFQVIIGNTVAEFYNDFTEVSGVSGVSKDAVKSAAQQNQNVLQRAVAIIAEIFAPIIPAIIVGGLILGFRNCIDALYLFEDGTKTLVDISTFWKGIDSFLWLIGEAVFHMLPVGICWSVTKKMGTTQMLGIVLGLTLVSGQLLNAYAVAGTPADKVPFWDFGFFTVNMIGYQAQVIPAILAAFTLVYLEKFFQRITPAVISMIVVPFCSLTLAVIAAHFVLGPIGWKLGSLVSSVVFSGITGSFQAIFAAVFGFIYAPLVITGLHHMTNAIDLQLIADYHGTMLWPMIALSNIAQGAAVLGMIFLQRRNQEAQEVNVPAFISCWLGVTEPAMFGVNLKYLFPFICGMTGSACAAVLCVMTGTTANAIGVGGVPGILSIQPQFMPTFVLSMLIAIAVPFALTVAVGKHKRFDKAAAAAEDSGVLTAFADGEVITLLAVNDGVFSTGMVGEGLAIRPQGDVLYAPAAAEVTMLMDESRHAVGLKLANGMELLLHVGLDTVDMQGDGFKYLVMKGDFVEAGTPLLQFDRQKIHAAGHDDVILGIVTNKGLAHSVELHTGMQAQHGSAVIADFA